MSDFNSSLPVRTENNGDVVVKVGDGTLPSQQLAIDSSGKPSVKLDDGSGTAITSTTVSAHQALDVNVVQTIAGAGDNSPATQNITAQDVGSTTNSEANGQSFITGSATANSTASFSFSSYESVAVQVTGTWTGTLETEISIDGGTTWLIRGVKQSGTSYLSNAFTNNFQGELNVAGSTNFRVRATTAWTGTATVKVVESANTSNIIVTNPQLLRDGVTQSIVNTIKAASTASVVGDTSLVTALSPNSPLPTGSNVIGAVNQGSANTVGNAWPIEVTDGTNKAAVKAASTPAAATDPSLVIALSPNSPVPTGSNLIGGASVYVGSTPNGPTNPVFVSLSDTVGSSIDNYQTSASLASNSSTNFDYTVSAAKTFYTKQMWATGSGLIKLQAEYETASGSGIFNTFWVGFNSTANPVILIPVPTSKTQVTGARIRMVVTNLDKSSQDVYSTLSGTEQ